MTNTNADTNGRADSIGADRAAVEQLLPPSDESAASTDDDDQDAVVLEEAETLPQYHHGAVSVLCPGCGDVVTRFTSDGLPPRLVHFEQECEACGTQLHRWCSVAVPSAFEHRYAPEELEQIVTSYFDRRIWAGIVSSPGNHPQNWEFSEVYAETAAGFNWEWNISCPLCRRSLDVLPDTWLDYHHWRRDPDQGVCLCRRCHESLTGGESDSDQDWTAKQEGFKHKHDVQIARLALREQAVAQHQTSAGLVQTVVDRYNLPYDSEAVSAIVDQALASPAQRDLVLDETLLSDI